MAIKTNPFNVSDHLNTPEDIRIFLQEVNETGTEAEFIHALNTAVRAKACINRCPKTIIQISPRSVESLKL